MGKKVFIAPIYGIDLTKDTNNEFKIIRTFLVSNNKLRRNRKKFGIQKQISKLPEIQKNVFEASSTFAIVFHNDNKSDEEVKKESLDIIQKELHIISLSSLQYKKRGELVKPTVMKPLIQSYEKYAVSRVNDRNEMSGNVYLGSPISPFHYLTLDRKWVTFQRKNFFFNLLKLIQNKNNKVRFAKKWNNDLIKVSILVGKSLETNDLEKAFLWNMIALEVLLTNSDDHKFLNILPKRIEAFFGWLNDWETDKFNEKIEEIYKKRSGFVHQAKNENLKNEDLEFTDLLIFNLLLNITTLPKLFTSKNALIDFSHKIEAQKTLSITRKPIGLKFHKVTRINANLADYW